MRKIYKLKQMTSTHAHVHAHAWGKREREGKKKVLMKASVHWLLGSFFSVTFSWKFMWMYDFTKNKIENTTNKFIQII